MLIPPLEVVICRAQDKAETLANILAKHKITCKVVPTFHIRPLAIKKTFDVVSVTDVIFTSTYALEFLPLPLLINLQQSNVRFWAIGKSTQKALLAKGIDALAPQGKSNSEQLLQLLSQEQTPYAKRVILIVKGKNGRKFLYENLSRAAAQVQMMNCYERVAIEDERLLNAAASLWPALFLFTSFDALRCGMKMFAWHPQWKKSAAITVTNSRMLNWANEAGFAKVYTLDDVTNEALVTFTVNYIKGL